MAALFQGIAGMGADTAINIGEKSFLFDTVNYSCDVETYLFFESFTIKFLIFILHMRL